MKLSRQVLLPVGAGLSAFVTVLVIGLAYSVASAMAGTGGTPVSSTTQVQNVPAPAPSSPASSLPASADAGGPPTTGPVSGHLTVQLVDEDGKPLAVLPPNLKVAVTDQNGEGERMPITGALTTLNVTPAVTQLCISTDPTGQWTFEVVKPLQRAEVKNPLCIKNPPVVLLVKVIAP